MRVDDVADILKPAARDEVRTLICALRPEDFTACELITMLTALRQADERKRGQARRPVSLELVRSVALNRAAEQVDRGTPC